MRTAIALLLAPLLAMSLGAAASAPANPLTIMPLGDSITKGACDRDERGGPGSGYRDQLYKRLKAGGVNFTFVGATRVNASKQLAEARQDWHNGCGSFRTDEILKNLDGAAQPGGGADVNHGGYWMTGGHGTGREAVHPDIILIHAGTNDCYHASAVEMEARLRNLLDWFKSNRPEAQVFVAQIVPIKNSEENTRIVEYNAWIAATVPTQFGGHFHVVNMYSLFTDSGGNLKAKGSNDGIYLVDGVHPSHGGYLAMGDAWFKAIDTIVPATH